MARAYADTPTPDPKLPCGAETRCAKGVACLALRPQARLAPQHTPIGERMLANVFVDTDSSDIAHLMQDKVTWRCDECAHDAGAAVVVPI